jgi:predicted RNA-binding Zn ribbon-like protein
MIRMSMPATDPPILLADHRALDFLNTLARPGGVETEWIGSGEGLLDWLRAASLVDPADERVIRRAIGADELDHAAREARALREWFRGVLSGGSLETALARLNTFLRDDEQVRQLHGARGHAAWRTQRLWRKPRSVLGPIAEQMGDLLVKEDLDLVKGCGGEDCTLVFLDRTKAHKRRWCSMAVCGNRAKVAAFRARSAD